MKRERVQFLVTVSLNYEAVAERHEAIKTAREDLMSTRTRGLVGSRPIRAVLIKRPTPHRSRTLPAGAGVSQSIWGNLT